VETYLHLSLYLRRKSLPLPSLSLYPLYSDVYLQMARLKAVVFVFAPLLPPHLQLAQPETSRRLPLVCRNLMEVAGYCEASVPVCRTDVITSQKTSLLLLRQFQINKIFSLLLIFNLHKFLYFIKNWCCI
jgi:hypothetical protein